MNTAEYGFTGLLYEAKEVELHMCSLVRPSWNLGPRETLKDCLNEAKVELKLFLYLIKRYDMKTHRRVEI